MRDRWKPKMEAEDDTHRVFLYNRSVGLVKGPDQ